MNAKIVAVTVLEDRAAVTRRGTVALAAGQHRLVLEGVSPVVADKTITAIATGGRVLDVRCERYRAPWRSTEGEVVEPSALRAERVRLETSRDAALARAAAAEVELEGLRELNTAALHDLAIAASRGTPPSAAGPQLAELDARELAARTRKLDAGLAAEAETAALTRLAARVARAEAEAGEDAARMIVDVLVETAADVALTIGYVVPGAAWRPYHRAELSRAAGRVEWTTTACVWQATGEDWDGVALTLSLDRSSLGVAPPDLLDDEVRSRRRPDHVAVEAREDEQQTTGLGTGAPVVPGIDDGGLGMTLTAARATVRKDGAPHRIAVGGFSTACNLSLVAVPLRSPWVHLRGRLVNAGAVPVLAGPVDLIMSSGYVGRAEVGFVAPGEKFYLGFGPESEVRVHRDEVRERDEAGFLGGWNVQTVRVVVRLSNLGSERRDVVITERIPISEVEQVDVQVGSPDAYLLGVDDQPGGEEITQVMARSIDEHGLVTWGVELPPRGRRAVTLEYRVRSQRSVAGV